MVQRASHYVVFIERPHTEPAWVRARMRKVWWYAKSGYASRSVAETWFHSPPGAPEGDLQAAALRELLLALEDRLS